MTILRRLFGTSSIGSSKPKPTTSETSIEIGGRRVPVTVRINAQARRILLRVDRKGGVLLTIPNAKRRPDALRFLDGRRDWVAARLATLPQPLPIAVGATIPLFGTPHRVRHDPAARHPLTVSDGEIVLGGSLATANARLLRWIKLEAKRQLERRAVALSGRIGREVIKVGVRDTRSRWGSCTRAGALSFSWRLLLAPERVLDYVVAHEVAHLIEFDHSPAFWALTERLHPGYEADRDWLRRHGEGLHRYEAVSA